MGCALWPTQWDIVVWDRGTISLHDQRFFINCEPFHNLPHGVVTDMHVRRKSTTSNTLASFSIWFSQIYVLKQMLMLWICVFLFLQGSFTVNRTTATDFLVWHRENGLRLSLLPQTPRYWCLLVSVIGKNLFVSKEMFLWHCVSSLHGLF